MKFKSLTPLFILLAVMPALKAQKFPPISESDRIIKLNSPSGKARIVLDTDTYNEMDDQFALCYAFLSKEKIQLEAVYAAPFYNDRSSGPGDLSL